MRANFIKLYDNNGNLIIEKVVKFDEIHMKHGDKEILSLRYASNFGARCGINKFLLITTI
jgi:hypothetical protein